VSSLTFIHTASASSSTDARRPELGMVECRLRHRGELGPVGSCSGGLVCADAGHSFVVVRDAVLDIERVEMVYVGLAITGADFGKGRICPREKDPRGNTIPREA